MKKLSDYKGEEAIELWADLMEPAGKILADKKIADVIKSKKAPIFIAKDILKLHAKEAMDIMLRIDDTPVDGLNAVTRLLVLIGEIMEDDTAKSFFDTQGQKMDSVSSGSATESTEEKET